MNKVMAFGTFDLFHKGHVNYLKQAKSYGGELVVVVSRDVNVERFKDKKPVHSEEERLENVERCEYVDKAMLGNKDDILKVVVEERPDFICLGYDQRVDEKDLRKELKERGLFDFAVVRAEPYKPEKYKTSKLRED